MGNLLCMGLILWFLLFPAPWVSTMLTASVHVQCSTVTFC